MPLFPIMTVGLAVATVPALAEEATLRGPADEAARDPFREAAWRTAERDDATGGRFCRRDR